MKTRTRFIIATAVTAAAFLIAAAFPTWAEDKPKRITVREAQALSIGLRNLDGHQVIVKENGVDTAKMIGWDFANGDLRKRVAQDLAIVDAVARTTEESRQRIFRELAKGAPEIKANTLEAVEMDRQMNEILNGEADGTERLQRIRFSELKTDRNEIAPTVLSALGPVLDWDK